MSVWISGSFCLLVDAVPSEDKQEDGRGQLTKTGHAPRQRDMLTRMPKEVMNELDLQQLNK